MYAITVEPNASGKTPHFIIKLNGEAVACAFSYVTADSVAYQIEQQCNGEALPVFDKESFK